MSEQQLEVKEFDHPPLPKNWLRTIVIIWLGQARAFLPHIPLFMQACGL